MGKKQYSDEELLKEIQRLSSPGDPVTSREMEENGVCGANTIKRRFGGWNPALTEAGVGVNDGYKYNTEEILQAIRKYSDSQGIALDYGTFRKRCEISMKAVRLHCNKWWEAVVRAGTYPCGRRPLTPGQYRRFHTAAVGGSQPIDSLIGLFLMFTGVPPELFSQMSSNWFDYLNDDRYDSVVEIPGEYVNSGDLWTFKLPQSFSIDGEREDTVLPEMTRWYLSDYTSKNQMYQRQAVEKCALKIARDAGLTQQRRQTSHGEEQYPDVMPADLRTSAGVQMARNGAPKRRIRRHLGIEHTGWKADVDDFFLWLYVHENYTHPDYDPPDVVLDPVDPDSPSE